MQDFPLMPDLGTHANAKRRFLKKTYVIDGEPVLRVFDHQFHNHHLREGVSVSVLHHTANEIKRSTSGRAMFRCCAVLFDTPNIAFPTVDQQYGMVKHYTENADNLLWDGWRDTVIQRINPTISTRSIAVLPWVRYALAETHFTHIIIPSARIFMDRESTIGCITGLAARGRTMTILDQGVDVLRYPDQLMGMAAASYATSDQNVVGRLSNLMMRTHAGIGWETVAGRQVPLPRTRDKLKRFVSLVNRRYAHDDPIPLDEYQKCYMEGQQMNRPCRFSRVTLDSLYLITICGFPQGVTVPVARAVVEVHGYRRCLGRKIDADHALGCMLAGMSEEDPIFQEVCMRYAMDYQERVLRVIEAGYVPDMPTDAVTYGLQAGEGRLVKKFEKKKRLVWRDVNKTALALMDGIKPTAKNRACIKYMREYFQRQIEIAELGYEDQVYPFGDPKPETNLLETYRSLAMDDHAVGLIRDFSGKKRAAFRALQKLCDQYPEWAANFKASWESEQNLAREAVSQATADLPPREAYLEDGSIGHLSADSQDGDVDEDSIEEGDVPEAEIGESED